MPNCEDPVEVVKHPFKCGGEAVGNAAGAVGDGLLQRVTNGIIEEIANLLTTLQTVWIETPSQSLSPDDPVGAAIVATQGYMNMLTLFFGVLGIMIAAGRMAWNARGEDIKEIIRMLMMLVFVQGAAVAAIQILLKAGDEFSVWLITAGTSESMHTNLAKIVPVVAVSGTAAYGPAAPGIAVGALLILAIIILISTALQFVFLLLRDVLLAIILVFLPTMAAASLFKGGSQAFDKAIGWIVAMLLYKPVAAGIYLLGILLIKGMEDADNKFGKSIAGLVLGVMVMLLATLALPALIKFVAPAAGRGVSSAFSGAAGVGMAAGAVATGAAIVALGATGGASAGAGAGAGTAGTAGTAGMTGNAGSTTGAMAPSGAPGGGGTPPPTSGNTIGPDGSAGGPGTGSSGGSSRSGAGGTTGEMADSESSAGQRGSSATGAEQAGTPGSQGSSSGSAEGASQSDGASSSGSQPEGASGAPAGPEGASSQGGSSGGGVSKRDLANAGAHVASAAGGQSDRSGAAIEDMGDQETGK